MCRNLVVDFLTFDFFFRKWGHAQSDEELLKTWFREISEGNYLFINILGGRVYFVGDWVRNHAVQNFSKCFCGFKVKQHTIDFKEVSQHKEKPLSTTPIWEKSSFFTHFGVTWIHLFSLSFLLLSNIKNLVNITHYFLCWYVSNVTQIFERFSARKCLNFKMSGNKYIFVKLWLRWWI